MNKVLIAGCLILLSVSGFAQASKDRANEILTAARKAKGAMEKLEGAKDVTVKGTASINIQGQDMELSLTSYNLPPDKLKQEIEIPAFNVSVTQMLNGSSGFMDSPQGSGDMPEVMVNSMRKGLLREWFMSFLVAPKGLELSVTAKPDAKVDTRDAEVLDVKIGEEAFTVYFDKTTHDLIKSSYQTLNQEMQQVNAESLYSEFKDVDGIKVSHHTISYQNGQKTAEVKISSVKINSGLDDTKFKK